MADTDTRNKSLQWIKSKSWGGGAGGEASASFYSNKIGTVHVRAIKKVQDYDLFEVQQEDR